MRVLHITPTFRPSIGGIESVIECLCRELVSRGIVSDVAHISSGIQFGRNLIGGTSVWQVPLIGCGSLGLAPHLSRIVEEYDILHVHDPQILGITLSVILFAKSKPAVLSTHGGFRHTKSFAFAKFFHELLSARILLNRYSRVLASSRSDYNWASLLSDKVVLCQNGVDVSFYSSLKTSTHRSPWNWLYWGRISKNKRLDVVLELARRARAIGHPVSLTICGTDFDGSKKGILELSKKNGEQWVNFKPSETSSQLGRTISKAGVFVTGSEYEGFGLTIVEALAAGLPVICRDVSPMNGFVDETCGLLLKFDDTEQDQRRLTQFLRSLESSHASLSYAARLKAQSFDWKIAVEAFISAYQQVSSMYEEEPFWDLKA